MARTTIRSEDITGLQVKTGDIAADAVTAAKIASGAVDTTGLEDDIALIGFKVAANGSLAKYNLVDQAIDAFEDASGVDASASTNEIRNSSKYYSGVTTGVVTATGGTITTDGDYTVHYFGSDANFVTDTEQDVEYLVVGGGGSGAGLYGGGGAGGYRTATGFTVAAGTYAVQVGEGGAAVENINTNGNSGESSIFSTITSAGGGAGGSQSAGVAGGSGGGGGGNAGSFGGGAGNTPSTSPSQGNSGGSGNDAGGGGGGGGASESGNPSGKNGGDGTSNDITGSAVTYAGGGGGGSYSGTLGQGGAGGGGAGGQGTGNGTGGTDGKGGGGGGGGYNNSYSGKGGDGVVIIRRPTSNTPTYNNMTLVSNATTAVDGAPTTGDLVITYTDGAGTASVNTDIKAYISRDGSAYTSAVTLVSQGTTGGHTILTANGVDLSGIASGTSMRWKVETLNQAVGKQTRIQAVSLGWS